MSLLSSLTNRIFLASALLVVVAIGVAIYRVNVSVAAQAEADLRAGLDEAAVLVDELSRAQFADFVVKGRLIADLPKLNGAAATDHPPTVEPIAQDYQQKIGADLFVVTGRQDRVLARAGRVQPDAQAIVDILVACRAHADGTCFWPYGGGVLHAVAIPMEAGLRSLIVGVSLDQEAVDRLRSVTNSEVAFAAGSRIVASTLDAARTSALAAGMSSAEVFSIRLGDEDFIGRSQPLASGGDPATPIAVVLRSRTEHLRFLSRLHWQIAVTALVAVLIATVLGYLIARTVTRPVRALTATMREVTATGDLARAVPTVGPWDDEDARLLSSTFRQMTESLDRSQREAAQRDRLSALGRLSTVIAHEIRNPLMIIKSAARTLRKVGSPASAEAAASIDEEVIRLDRVVAGVLDFARPIQFDLAPADLHVLCRDAAQAAAASGDDVPIALELESGPATIVTDAERLRSVLVNVLANAQQAVRSPTGDRQAPPLVQLRASRKPDAGWQIEVIDRGGGIEPADLPRVFDPFFTTRRGGSGLGLAIARNIIEGLGGTIGVESRVRVGTTVRIDLPARAADPEGHA